MSTQPLLNRFVCLLVIASLLLGPATSVTHAQTGDSLYLPLITNGSSQTHPHLLFRTQVTVPTPAAWHDLARFGVLILEKQENSALLLVDDRQLTDLARLRYNPEQTNALDTLTAANRALAATTGVQRLLVQEQATWTQLQASQQVATQATRSQQALYDALHTVVATLTAAEQTQLAQTASADSDSDGLSDDQEGFWCTDPSRADSDFDGTKDGAEVSALKAWMGNQRAQYPSTGKPFQGWPPQKQNCFDDDQDAVPDLAESLELGLNPGRESTDRDKFDDGQELFGQTYCTGQGGFCSYGPLPRNEDWGVIFAEMPSWVKAPGNHPLVAALPIPKVNVVPSSLKVETVTTVTTDHTISSGTEKSYSTSSTEGKSRSIAETATWNRWQEVSRSRTAESASGDTLYTDGETEFPPYDPKRVHELETEAVQLKMSAAKWSLGNVVPVLGPLIAYPGQQYEAQSYAIEKYVQKWQEDAANKCDPNAPYLVPKCIKEQAGSDTNPNLIPGQNSATNSQDRTVSGSYLDLSISQNNQLNFKSIFNISYPVMKPPPMETFTSGKSVGAAQTVSTESYEEHTVTNGEAFSTEESWSTATAIDSAHAADLWLTYKVRNLGTEYAREIANLAFNIYIGDDPNPAVTYFVAPDLGGNGKLQNFMPNEEHSYTTRRIPLSLEQMKAIDLGGPIRVVIEDFTYGIDELFYQDAANAGVLIAMEDGTGDGDETIDNYLFPTWGQETVLNVLARYFPHQTDADGTIIAIWTPEYRTDTPGWCQEPKHPTDYSNKAVWCKHALSTADWWNVYTDGLGDGSEGFQDTSAAPGSVALFRFNQDSDLDGFSDRSEARLGTDANDASSFPHPELLAGLHNIKTSNKVTSTLSLLNTGIYDAYGVEAVMVAPDDSISITNNTVGGSGRVRALKQVIVGSRILLPSPLPGNWTQAGHAVPAAGGYYTGSGDRTYTLTVACGVAECSVGSGNWKLTWSDGQGASGQLDFGASYQSPTFLTVGNAGVTLALYSGKVSNGESFTVQARTPRDTFQYTINREPYTPPLVIVSYNDPQGNHRFVIPSQAMNLTAPTDNLNQFAGEMLYDAGVEIVTGAAFAPGSNSAKLLVNNPAASTLSNAHLFLEVINISGTVVAEIPTQVTLPPGPTYTTVTFNTGSFTPAYQAAEDYIVMAFLTDYQGNILDTAGRPLSSFQVDPLPQLAADNATLTWSFGTVSQGAVVKYPIKLANTGFGRLYIYLPPGNGLSLNRASRTVGVADISDYELTLGTAALPLGPYDRTITIATSDPSNPTRSLRVVGTITAGTGDATGGSARPLDVAVNVSGSHNQGEWYTFTHNLGPEPQSLHPVKMYSQDYSKLWGVGQFVVPPANCTDIKQRYPYTTDGIYVINLKNDPLASVQIYCHDMNGTPKEYLQLVNIGGGFNYSMGASGGWWPGTDVYSRFYKLRLDVNSLLIDRSDMTFAGSAGHINWDNNNPIESFSYAIAATCKWTSEGLASANIDLRGTPFRLDDSVAFQVFGYLPSGNISVSSDRQVVNLTGGGACGYTEPSTPLVLKYLGGVTDNSFIVQQISANTTNIRLPETISIDKVYNVQFGRKLDFAAAGSQVTTLRVPAGLYSSVTLDALISSLPADATLSIDIGNDGATEWSGAAGNNSTNASPDLASAFTAYWRSQNSPTNGTMDVPVKVTTSQPGQYLLTNLQLTTTGSRSRQVRLPVRTYTNFLLDFTTGTGGTVALDLGDNGSIDWSTTLNAPRQLTANLKDALNAYLTGKSGQVDVPLRFYVSPFHDITLNDYQATATGTADLVAETISIGSGVQASSLLYNEGAVVPVQATLRNSSGADSGPVTAAFFAMAPGWGDWYIGSTFVANIPANSNVAVSTQWNTNGFGSDAPVPVKVVVNPYGRTGETSFTNNSKSASVTVTPTQVAQTITFGTLADKMLNADPFVLTATASSGLVASFSSLTPTVCTVSSNTVTLIASGICTIQSTQAGNAFFLAAPAVTQSFAVKSPTKPDQTITFATLPNKTLGDSPFGLTATASSGLAVSFIVQTPSVCTVTGTTVTLVAAGTCSIQAIQNGDATYNPATPVTQQFNVSVKPSQSITFAELPDKTFGDPPFIVNATASSSLPVSFSTQTTEVCTINGNTVTLVAVGTCTIRASQAGNESYQPASPVERSFVVNPPIEKLAQTISFEQPSDKTLDGATVVLNATASSGLSVTFTSNSSAVCTVSGNTVTLLATGECSITATQEGNDSYLPALAVTQRFTVLIAEPSGGKVFMPLIRR